MQKTKYPIFVAPVQSDDEYNDSPNYCAIEGRPSVVLMIAWIVFVTHIYSFLTHCWDTRLSFHAIKWLEFQGSEDNESFNAEEVIAEGCFVSQAEIEAFFRENGSVRGYELSLHPVSGCFSFNCYQKHDTVEFCTNEISISDLVRGLNFGHVLAEIGERVQTLIASHFNKTAVAE
jgi:hypothetical protein